MSLIQAQGIKKIFHIGEITQEVLKGVNIDIEEGEFVAIMGRSGAGKSTLLYQLSALDVPSEGSVTIDGNNLRSMSEDELADFRLYTMGYVFQDYALIPDLSALENVITPLLMRGIAWDAAEEMAQQALTAVGLVNKAKSVPSQMSGGEQQRVSIARAIAGAPKILFADEPTANLDSASGRSIINLLTTLHKTRGQTIVMVTHEVEYTAQCDRIITLDDGRVADAVHSQLPK